MIQPPIWSCLQHQIKSAVAVTIPNLITAVDGDATTFQGDLSQVCAALLVHFFSPYVQSDPDKPQDIAIAPTCHYQEEGPPLSLQLPFKSSGQELKNVTPISLFVLVLCSGVTLHAHCHCYWRGKCSSVAVASPGREELHQIQALWEGWESSTHANP